MALTGNKGEWSEIYTLLKLLGEGKVYAGDQNLNKIQDLFYPIVMILRQEKDGNFNYKLHDINPEKPDVPLNKNDAFQKVQKRRVQEKR